MTSTKTSDLLPDLWRQLTRVWHADIAEARASRAEGDRAMEARCLRRAAIARRWIAEDLRGIRAWGDRQRRRKQLTRRLFRMQERHDARKAELLHQIKQLEA